MCQRMTSTVNQNIASITTMVLKGLRVLWVYLGEIISYGYNFGTDGAESKLGAGTKRTYCP